MEVNFILIFNNTKIQVEKILSYQMLFICCLKFRASYPCIVPLHHQSVSLMQQTRSICLSIFSVNLQTGCYLRCSVGDRTMYDYNSVLDSRNIPSAVRMRMYDLNSPKLTLFNVNEYVEISVREIYLSLH